jgi:hypothetical protein
MTTTATSGPQATSPGPVTYTLDQVGVATLKITTAGGEAAARRAAAALLSISVQATLDELECGADMPGDAVIDVTCIAPRGTASLVYAADAAGRDVRVTDDGGLPEPIDGGPRGELARLLARWRAASGGQSADAEHAAGTALAEAVAALLGQRPGGEG